MNDPTAVRALEDLGQQIPDRRPAAAELLRAGKRARRKRNQRNVAILVAVVAPMASAAAVLGLGSDSNPGNDGFAGPPSGSADVVGENPVISMSQPSDDYPSGDVSGVLTRRNGCLLIGDSVAFWPYGTTWSGDQQAVVFPATFGAAPTSVGSVFEGGGGYYTGDQAASIAGPKNGMAIRSCIEQTRADGAVLAVPNG